MALREQLWRCYADSMRPPSATGPSVPHEGSLRILTYKGVDVLCCRQQVHTAWCWEWLRTANKQNTNDPIVVFPTHSGRLVNLLDPDPDDFLIEDIVTGLSNIVRYNGQTNFPYNVASHSVRMAIILAEMGESEAIQKEALLHDAHEAYLGELPRMIKNAPFMAGYREVEARVDTVIRAKFGLPVYQSQVVSLIDKDICFLETRSYLMSDGWRSTMRVEPTKSQSDLRALAARVFTPNWQSDFDRSSEESREAWMMAWEDVGK